MTARFARGLALVLVGVGAACAPEARIDRTTLEVRIASGLAVPGELDEIKVVARVPGPPERIREYRPVLLQTLRDLPVFVAFTPARGLSEPFDIEVSGYRNKTQVAFSWSRVSGFVQGETRRLKLALTTDCRTKEGCAPPAMAIDPRELPRVADPTHIGDDEPDAAARDTGRGGTSADGAFDAPALADASADTAIVDAGRDVPVDAPPPSFDVASFDAVADATTETDGSGDALDGPADAAGPDLAGDSAADGPIDSSADKSPPDMDIDTAPPAPCTGRRRCRGSYEQVCSGTTWQDDTVCADQPCTQGACKPAHGWFRRFGSTTRDFLNAVAVDPSGNVVVGGGFEGTVDFGEGPRTSSGPRDAFLIEFTATGDVRWTRVIGGPSGIDHLTAVAVDRDRRCALGYAEGVVDFGGTSLTNPGRFLACYAPDGKLQWVTSMPILINGNNSQPLVLGADGVYVAGFFHNGADFGGGKLLNRGKTDVVVAAYSLTGTLRWAQSMGGADYDSASGIGIDATSNLYIAGSFNGPADFGGAQPIETQGKNPGIYLASYGPSGQHRWSKGFPGGVAPSMFTAVFFGNVVVDPSGKFCVVGGMNAEVDLGKGPLTPTARGSNGFVACYGSDGTPLWSRALGLSLGVAMDGKGSVYVAGSFSTFNDFDLGGGTLPRFMGFAASYTLDTGVHRWSTIKVGHPVSVSADPARGRLYLGGSFGVPSGRFDFGAGPVTTAGMDDAFVLRLDL